MINEAARHLEKGAIACISDIDVICRYGYGFPIWRGGPMFIAEEIRLSTFLEKLDGRAK